MKKNLINFWGWYEKHLFINTLITSFLFILQLIHLYWLTADVVLFHLFGRSFFHLTDVWRILVVLVDYTEIPALITTSILYINEHRKNPSLKAVLFLLFINIQWLHLFWITDEFVIEALSNDKLIQIPVWLAWIAVAIDYLELPVIFDTLKKSLKLLQAKF